MKALLLDGSRAAGGLEEAAEAVIREGLGASGWQVETIMLRDARVNRCNGCFGCWVKTPGVCVMGDEGREIAQKAISSDMLVLLTPVTFGGYSSELKRVVERLIPLVLPFFMRINGEVHHRPRYNRYPALAGFGTLSGPDAEAEELFRAIVRRNAVNLHSPVHSAVAINTVQPPEEMQQEILRVLRECRGIS